MSKIKKALGSIQKGVRGGIYRLGAAGKKIYGKPKVPAAAPALPKNITLVKRIREGITMAVDVRKAGSPRNPKFAERLGEIRDKRHGIKPKEKHPTFDTPGQPPIGYMEKRPTAWGKKKVPVYVTPGMKGFDKKKERLPDKMVEMTHRGRHDVYSSYYDNSKKKYVPYD